MAIDADSSMDTSLTYANMKTRKVKSPSKKSEVKHKKVYLRRDQIYGILLSIALAAVISLLIVIVLGTSIPWIVKRLMSVIRQIFNLWFKTNPVILPLSANLTFSKFRANHASKKPMLFPSNMTIQQRIEVYNLLNGEYSKKRVNVDKIERLGKGGMDEMVTSNGKSRSFLNFRRSKRKGEIFSLKFFRKENFSANTYDPYYLSESDAIQQMPRVLKQISVPNFLSCRNKDENVYKRSSTCPFDEGKYFLSLGRNGSGMSFHYHGESWSDLIYGKKVWFLYKASELPPMGFDPAETMSTWIERVYPRLLQKHMPLEIIQEAGQVVYIPEGWYHSTMTFSQESIAVMQRSVATEFGSRAYFLKEALKMEAAFDYNAAITSITLGLQAESDPLLHHKLGELQEKVGNLNAAEKAYKEAISKNKKNPQFYISNIKMWEKSSNDRTDDIQLLLRMAKGLGISQNNDDMQLLYSQYIE